MSSGALIDVQAGTFIGASNANDVWTNNKADLNVETGATFDGAEGSALAAGGIFVNKLTGAGTIKLGYTDNGLGTDYANSLTFGVDGGSASFDGVLANGAHAVGRFVKSGTGTQTLTGTSTATGSMTINNGTLALGNATNTLANTMAVTVDGAGAILSIGGNSDTVGAVTLKNGASITGTGGTLTGASYAVESGSVSANLGGAVSLTKTTAGTVTLSGTNTYTGTTTVNAGTLSLSGSGSISDLTAVVVNSPGAFDISGISTSEKIASLSGVSGSTLKLGSKTLEFGDSNDTSFLGTVDDGGGTLKKVGTGTFTLAASAYPTTTSPNINISQGTLLTGVGNLQSSSAFTLSGGKLATGSFSNTVGSLTVEANSVIDFAGGGTPILTFSSQGAWTGLLQIWNWTGSIGSTGTGGQLKFLDGSNGSLIDGSKVQFYSGAGTGALGNGGVFVGTELVPIPEPSALFSGAVILGLIGFRSRRAEVNQRRAMGNGKTL